MTRQSSNATRLVAPPAHSVTGSVLHRKCGCGRRTAGGGECGGCRRRRQGLHRHANHGAEVHRVPAIVSDVLQTPGAPLESSIRADMEPRFGCDFSRVRVHTDSRAAESATAVDAQAYTVANHVVFGAGNYAPSTIAGRRLLAHELTHVVQQRGRSFDWRAPLFVAPSHDAAEREADRVAEQIVAGRRSSVTGHEESQALRRADASCSTPAPPPAPGPAPAPKNVCGPVIDSPLYDAINRIKQKFATSSIRVQVNLCEAMINPVSYNLSYDWDIHELFITETSMRHYGESQLMKGPDGFYRADYGCGLGNGVEDLLPGPDPQSEGCDSSCTLRGQCQRARSVNYVAYGLMWKLAWDFNEKLLNDSATQKKAEAAGLSKYLWYIWVVRNRFTTSKMQRYIKLYKAFHINKASAVAWALAGYAGWPASTTPAPEMTQCSNCGKAFAKAFTISWAQLNF